MKQYYRTHLTSLRLRVDRPLSVEHPLSVHRSLSVHRQNMSNRFKRTAIDRMFLYILPFLSSTIYTKLDELTLLLITLFLGVMGDRPHYIVLTIYVQ